MVKPHETFVQMSTISTHYKPIYIDPNAKVDLETNETPASQISQTKLWAVIPAAGSGSRFSKTELKQYQYIQNTTVLEHTVRA